jgi:hypothetical protein
MKAARRLGGARGIPADDRIAARRPERSAPVADGNGGLSAALRPGHDSAGLRRPWPPRGAAA